MTADLDNEQWSTPRHYGRHSSARRPPDDDDALLPLAGPGDCAMLAVALATGDDVAWSQPTYHGPRRHLPSPVPVVTPVAHPADAEPVAAIAQPASESAEVEPTVIATSAKMAVASLASRATGFLRTIALAAALGSGGVGGIADAYNLANTLPNMVYELLLGGVLTSVIIPILIKAQRDDADDGLAYTQRLLTIVVTALGVGTVLAVIAAPLLIDIFGGTQQAREVATLWASLLLPEIFFYGLGAMLSAILNVRNVYGWPAWAPVLNNVITIVALGLFVLLPGPTHLSTANITNGQILIVGLGTTLGIAAQAVVLLVPLRKLGFTWNWRFRAHPNEVGRMAEFRTLSTWVLGYVAISQVGVVVVNVVARPRGGVTIFAYADLLFQVPYGILGVSLLTALMPRMSRAAAAGNMAEVLRNLSLGARLSAVALVPITVGLIVFGPAFTSVILLGHFTVSDARLTGIALACAAFGLLPFALLMLQQRVFYAMRDTRTPTLINLAMVATKITLIVTATQVLNSRQVIIALTVSTSLSYVAGAAIGHLLLQRRFGTLGFTPVLRTTGLMAAASGLAGAAGVIVILISDGLLGTSRLTALVELGVGGALAIGVLAVTVRRLPLPEVADAWASIRGRTRPAPLSG